MSHLMDFYSRSSRFKTWRGENVGYLARCSICVILKSGIVCLGKCVLHSSHSSLQWEVDKELLKRGSKIETVSTSNLAT